VIDDDDHYGAAEGPFSKKKKRRKSGLRRLRKYNFDRYTATLEVLGGACHTCDAKADRACAVVCVTRVQSLGRGSRAGQGCRGELLLRAGRTLPPPASPLLLCVRVPLPIPSLAKARVRALTTGVQILRQLHVHQVPVAVLLRAMQGHARGTPLPEVQSLSCVGPDINIGISF
jgi:hypothetical protein